jgi:hypothetical protein
MSDSLTLADLRRQFRQPRHVLNYALETYGPAPTFRVGLIRFWSRDLLPQIQESLGKTAQHSRVAERRLMEAAT